MEDEPFLALVKDDTDNNYFYYLFTFKNVIIFREGKEAEVKQHISKKDIELFSQENSSISFHIIGSPVKKIYKDVTNNDFGKDPVYRYSKYNMTDPANETTDLEIKFSSLDFLSFIVISPDKVPHNDYCDFSKDCKIDYNQFLQFKRKTSEQAKRNLASTRVTIIREAYINPFHISSKILPIEAEIQMDLNASDDSLKVCYFKSDSKGPTCMRNLTTDESFWKHLLRHFFFDRTVLERKNGICFSCGRPRDMINSVTCVPIQREYSGDGHIGKRYMLEDCHAQDNIRAYTQSEKFRKIDDKENTLRLYVHRQSTDATTYRLKNPFSFFLEDETDRKSHLFTTWKPYIVKCPLCCIFQHNPPVLIWNIECLDHFASHEENTCLRDSFLRFQDDFYNSILKDATSHTSGLLFLDLLIRKLKPITGLPPQKNQKPKKDSIKGILGTIDKKQLTQKDFDLLQNQIFYLLYDFICAYGFFYLPYEGTRESKKRNFQMSKLI